MISLEPCLALSAPMIAMKGRGELFRRTADGLPSNSSIAGVQG
jgi:hypothetical protein